MNILITGGTGYLGIHVINKLVKLKNVKIIILDNFINSNPKILDNILNKEKKKIILKKIDITNLKKLKKIFKECNIDHIIHLAALIDAKESIKNKKKYLLTNFQATKNLIDLSNKHNVKKFIFTSSAAVYGNTKHKFCYEGHKTIPINPYGISKLKAEKYIKLKSRHTKYYILRIFNLIGHKKDLYKYFQNRQSIYFKIIKSIKTKKKNFKLFNFKRKKFFHSTERDFINVNDVSKIITKLIFMKKNNLIFNCGTGKRISMLNLINYFENKFNYKLNIINYHKTKQDPESIVASISKFKKYFKNIKLKLINV